MNTQHSTFNIQHSAQKGLPNSPVLVSCMFFRNTPSIFSGLMQHFLGTTYSVGAIKPYQNRCGGATLLIAILMASVMLSVGLGVYQRTYKELYFASFWKQAQIAFAAADSGLECALYWDLHPATNYTCFENPQNPWSLNLPTSPGSATTNFSNIPVFGGCVNIEIIKNDPPIDGIVTIIKSRGYNTCDPNNPRRVERGLRIDY